MEETMSQVHTATTLRYLDAFDLVDGQSREKIDAVIQRADLDDVITAVSYFTGAKVIVHNLPNWDQVRVTSDGFQATAGGFAREPYNMNV